MVHPPGPLIVREKILVEQGLGGVPLLDDGGRVTRIQERREPLRLDAFEAVGDVAILHRRGGDVVDVGVVTDPERLAPSGAQWPE